MTFGEIIQRVVQIDSDGSPSDDSRLSWRRVGHMIITNRSVLLSQEAKKNQKMNRWNYQTLCVEMINAPINECAGFPTPDGCVILRSKYQLPRPLTDYNRHLISSVTSFDGSTVFSEIDYEDAKYQKGNKYTSTKPNYYIKNGYIYLTTKNRPPIIFVEGTYDNPIEVWQYPSACDTPETGCIAIPDRDFPIDGDMIKPLVEMVVEELKLNKGQDLQNNKEDETT